jgi:hypothetical protein
VPSTGPPDWHTLRVFPISLGILIILALVLYSSWGGKDKAGKKPSLTAPLQYLDSTWSFTDSWVANVTVLGGLLTGVFGSTDVVKPFLGDSADSSIALATIGAAVAAAFVAAGPILLLATKQKGSGAFTIGGLLGASILVLTGAYGEIWVVYNATKNLSLSGFEDLAVVFAILAGLLLALYAWRSTMDTLAHGTDEPPKPPKPDAIKAAELVAAALKAQNNADVGAIDKAIQPMNAQFAPPAAEPTARRRQSALL